MLTVPAAHPRVRDGRWRVVVEADTFEMADRRVAECLSTCGRNLIRPEQPLGARASRDADLLTHRYGIGMHRWPLIDVAAAYGIMLSHAHETIAGMITRATQFQFELTVLDSIAEATAAGLSSTTTVADVHMRDLLGPSLSMAQAAAFTIEILARRIDGIDARVRRPLPACRSKRRKIGWMRCRSRSLYKSAAR